MNQVWCSFLVLASAIFINSYARAADSISLEQPKYAPVEAKQASWVFSGTVAAENGENYGYFFQMQRDNNHFHATAALIDEHTKHVIFSEDSSADIEGSSTPYNWRVGRAFLRFNTINDSWIFGVKAKNQLGFNFKVDMLKQFVNKPGVHHLKPGVTMMVSQTSELNGHILIESSNTEQFVRANDSWFRQVWQDEADIETHVLNSVLCQFNDGSGFYSVNLHESDAQSGAIAGWYNSEGVRQSISQFIQVSSQEGDWHIKSQSPKIDLALKDPTQVDAIVAGFIDGKTKPGFCMVNQEAVS